MKSFFKGLLAAFIGFMLISGLALSIYLLALLRNMEGYTAVAVFLAAVAIIVAGVVILYRLGKG